MAYAQEILAVCKMRYVLPTAALIILILFGKGYITKAYKKHIASFINGLIPRYNEMCGKQKEQIFAELDGLASQLKCPLQLLEIGSAGGSNFKYYPRGCRFTALDPNPYFRPYILENSKRYPHVHLEKLVEGVSEDMAEIADDSMDAVVSTYTLCTVQDVDKTLSEVLRVLKPGGKFFYVEHVRAEKGTWLRLAQEVFKYPIFVVSDNCYLTRETWNNINKAGFSEIEQQKFNAINIKGFLHLIKSHLMGVATK